STRGREPPRGGGGPVDPQSDGPGGSRPLRDRRRRVLSGTGPGAVPPDRRDRRESTRAFPRRPDSGSQPLRRTSGDRPRGHGGEGPSHSERQRGGNAGRSIHTT